VVDGLFLMLWGFFKKLVIADRLALFVDEIYGNPGLYEGVVPLLATYAFAFQIYCDFSGYSDIAIGGARVLGYDLMKNFDRPYAATSVRNFWRRWHISLSTWFRDYLYIPLGGRQGSRWRHYRSLMIVFLISGLWHGANWTFVVWGALHGLYLLGSLVTAPWRERLAVSTGYARWRGAPAVRVLITFHLVVLAWVFFRASSISDAFVILESMFHLGFNFDVLAPAGGRFGLLVAICAVFFMEAVEARGGVGEFRRERPLVARWALYYALIFWVVAFGVFDESQFIYFQF
jgi:D-alanyl-lipoteichoic acid acyltransferase DltB (MBOAT superfamily)